MADAPSHAVPPALAAPAFVRALRAGAVGLGTGILVGAVVGGLGARIVMRLLFLANDSTKGDLTENGNRVGVITLGGTVSLVLVAAFLGANAGVLYVLLRRWLPGPSVVKGLVLGALLLVLLSGGSIDPDNVDFRIFRPAGLGLVLFGLLPFLYGMALAPLVDRWDGYVPALFRRRAVTYAGGALLAGVAIYRAVGFAGNVSELL